MMLIQTSIQASAIPIPLGTVNRSALLNCTPGVTVFPSTLFLRDLASFGVLWSRCSLWNKLTASAWRVDKFSSEIKPRNAALATLSLGTWQKPRAYNGIDRRCKSSSEFELQLCSEEHNSFSSLSDSSLSLDELDKCEFVDVICWSSDGICNKIVDKHELWLMQFQLCKNSTCNAGKSGKSNSKSTSFTVESTTGVSAAVFAVLVLRVTLQWPLCDPRLLCVRNTLLHLMQMNPIKVVCCCFLNQPTRDVPQRSLYLFWSTSRLLWVSCSWPNDYNTIVCDCLPRSSQKAQA